MSRFRDRIIDIRTSAILMIGLRCIDCISIITSIVTTSCRRSSGSVLFIARAIAVFCRRSSIRRYCGEHLYHNDYCISRCSRGSVVVISIVTIMFVRHGSDDIVSSISITI